MIKTVYRVCSRAGLFLLAFALFFCNTKRTKDNKQIAEEQNKEKFITLKSKTEAQLCVDIADANLFEVKLLELSEAKSVTPAIVQLSKFMKQNHEKIMNELSAMAGEKMISLPHTLENKKKKEISSLKNRPDDEFDKNVLVKLKEGEEQMLRLLESALVNTSDQEYKNWLNKKIIIIRSNLDMIKSCNACRKPQARV